MPAPVDVLLLLDTEDIFSPPEVGNDDSILDLANVLTEAGLRATFLVIGDRAELLRDRGRTDVIEALRHHDIGLHTRSARHPTSPEYVQGRSWDDGVAEALRHEREGVDVIEDVFGRRAAAISAHYEYTTPHSQRAAALLGVPYVYTFPAAPPLYSLSWYAGALGVPWSSPTPGQTELLSYIEGFDDHYPDDAAFERKLAALDARIDACQASGQPFLAILLYHPQRLRLAEFIDPFWSPNGVNYPRERWGDYGRPARYTEEQVATALSNFGRLARFIAGDPRLRPRTVSEIAVRYGAQPSHLATKELLAASRDICAADEIALHPRYSPAEILVGLAEIAVTFARKGRLPEQVVRLDVMGPRRNPIWFPEAQTLSWENLVQKAESLLGEVAATGHLPSTLDAQGRRVGVNHLYRALAETVLDIAGQGQPTEVRLRPMPRYPALAEDIGRRYLRVAEGGLLDPDLDVDALYRHGKLQTWTLKPAMRPVTD